MKVRKFGRFSRYVVQSLIDPNLSYSYVEMITVTKNKYLTVKIKSF